MVRRWEGTTRPAAADPYVRHLETAVFPELSRIEGYRGAYLLRRDGDEAVEFVVLTLWDSESAIARFAGSDPEKAVIPPEARALLSEYEERARHYRVVRAPG